MKRIHFKTTSLALSLSVLLVFSACTGMFEEYNQHPTNPNPDDLTVAERVGILFPGMIVLMHNWQENDNQMIEQMVGNQYGGYMVTTNNWQGRNFGTFNPSPEWIAVPFNKLFSGFYSNYLKVKSTTGSKGYEYAWANIIRVAVMLRVVDTYGPIPYSKMGGGQLTVEYDGVQDVYHHMFDDLNNSITVLTAFVEENRGKASPMSEFDIVYGGDFSKWIKFANSLKLRMAVRIAKIDEEYAVEQMESAIAGGMIESNDDNAFLPTTDNPYRKSAFDWGDLAVSATLSAYMNGWSDPRRPVYMTQTVAAVSSQYYCGVRMGIDGIEHAYYSSAGAYSRPNFAANSPMLIYCAAETYFLLAEATLRGWITGSGTAQSLYERGIDISMEQHGVAVGNYKTGTASPQTYTDPKVNTLYNINIAQANNGGAVTVSWTNNASTDEHRLEKIITQKWLANYPSGFEAWCDFRRTGCPRLLAARDNKSSSSTGGSVQNPGNIQTPTSEDNMNPRTTAGAVRMARRLPYPISEYNGNPDNVRYAVSNLLGGPDEFSTNLWWARTE